MRIYAALAAFCASAAVIAFAGAGLAAAPHRAVAAPHGGPARAAGQIAAIHAIIGDNARPTQPLHGRLLVAGAD